jgi:uncharacterized membrane protein (DUF2068 family)
MFCDGCGTTLNPGSQFCPSCGKKVIPSPGPVPGQLVTQAPVMDRVKRNIAALSALWLVYGVLRVVRVVWLLGFGRAFLPWIMGNMGGHGWPMGGWGMESLISMGLYTAGITAAVFAAAYLVLAWGLYEKQPWARILGIVLGSLVLLRFPFGTALGIYTLWVLLPATSGREYEQIARA